LNSKYTRDEHLQRRRKLFPEVSDADWNDWKWQVRNRIETVEELSKHIKLTGKEIEGIKDCLATLRMAITPYYLTLIDPDNPNDPVRKQAILQVAGRPRRPAARRR
jgi:lysine 2,3-aminomutase